MIDEIIKELEEIRKDDKIRFADQVLDRAINIVKKYEDNKWVPCCERLPEESGFYLVTLEYCIDDSAIEFLYYDKDKNIFEFVADGDEEKNMSWREECDYVIAWELLPKQYRKGVN